jgi:membrane-bound ClpP family serine protease
MDIAVVVILCLVGVLLILAEIFLIPGITVAVVAGIGASIGGICYAFSCLGVVAGIVALFSVLLAIGIACIFLVKSKAMNNIALTTDIDSTITTGNTLNVEVGDEGITLSRMNPIGKVKVRNTIMEGKSIDDYIEEKTPIVVTGVSPSQLIVKQL